MKFLTSDLLFPVISACVISTFSILLYNDFNKKIEVGNVKRIGTISYKREVAQRKYQSQVVWEGIEQNFPVYNNDSIRTSDMSEAVIHLLDGTDISIQENSMIMLSSKENAININFEQGTISANRTGVRGTDIAAIHIKSQDATVSIDKSNIQLTQLENQELDLTVSDGTAKVKSATGETLIKPNEKALISSDRKETTVVQLKFNLIEPAPNRYTMTETPKSDVTFKWELAGNFRNINLEISRDRTFKKPLVSQKKLNVNTIKKTLDAGIYYWRVYALNSDTGKNEYSEPSKFELIYGKPVKLIAPALKETIRLSVSQNSVSFKWSEDKLASYYTLEVSKDREFSSVISRTNTSLRNITVDLDQGEYFWRVVSSVNIGGENVAKTSPVSTFIIDKLKTISPPVLISPAKGEKIDAARVKSKGIVLSWKNDTSFSSYEVEVARDSDFKSDIIDQHRRLNFIDIKKELAPGKYFWRVEGKVSTGEDVPYSKVGEFEIVVNDVLTLINPISDDEIKIPAKAKKRDIQFKWKRADLGGNYKLQISKQADFSGVKTINAKNQNSATVPFSEQGEFYWRVVLTDSRNNEILRSNASKFTVTTEEAVPVTKTYLVVTAPLKNAKIYINSKYKGKSQFKQEVRPDVKMSVKITASGYKDFTTDVKVASGETYTLSPKMQRSKNLERVKWVSALKSPISSAPVFVNDRIVLCSESGTVDILNNSGSVLVSKKITKRFESKPVVYKENIYTVDVNGYLYSINTSDGNVNWKIKAGGPLLFKSEPVVSNGKIFLATGFGSVEAYDLTGKKLWENELDEAIYNSLVYVQGSLIIATDALKLYSLNSEDGDENWATRIDGRVITSAPLVDKDKVYFGCYSGTFYAVSAVKGRILWTFKSGGPVYSSPVTVGGSVYFGSEDGYLYSLNGETGALNWKFKSAHPFKNSPIHAFESIVVASERTVYSLNPSTGSVLWENTFNSRIITSPTFAGDTVILGLGNGNIVSVRNNLVVLTE